MVTSQETVFLGKVLKPACSATTVYQNFNLDKEIIGLI